MLALDSSKALHYSSEFQNAAAKLHPILLPLGIDNLHPKVDHSPPHPHPHLPSLPPTPLKRAVTTSHLNLDPAGHGLEKTALPRRPTSDANSIQSPLPAWDEETSSLNKTHPLLLIPTIQPEAIKLSRSTSTASQKEIFERHLFQNSAILCDL
jgi:hypothetical protein